MIWDTAFWNVLDVRITVKPWYYLVHGKRTCFLVANAATAYYEVFHSSKRYSMPFDPFSVSSKESDITQWDNKSTRGQELDWPLVTFGLARFSSAICLWTPPHDQRKALWPSTKAQTIQIQRSVWVAQFHILGPASHKNPTHAHVWRLLYVVAYLNKYLGTLSKGGMRRVQGTVEGAKKDWQWAACIGHVIGDFSLRQRDNSWLETGRTSVVCWPAEAEC